MRTIALAILPLLAACGPDLSSAQYAYRTGGLSLRAEVPFVEGRGEQRALTMGRADHDTAMVRRVLDEVGLVPSSTFDARFGALAIVVRDTYDLQPGTPNVVTAGLHHVRGPYAWIELTRDGLSLGHELMHEIGGCSHDERNVWACPAYQAAEQEFNANALRWDF